MKRGPPEDHTPHKKHKAETDHYATVLQRFWRSVRPDRTTKHIMGCFAQHGPTRANVQGLDFQDLNLFLRREDVLSVSKPCIARLFYLCSNCHAFLPMFLENCEILMILQSVMFVHHSQRAFEVMGPLQQKLLDASTALLDVLEQIWQQMGKDGLVFAQVPHALTEDLVGKLFRYLQRYKAWSAEDKPALLMKMKCALFGLYQAMLDPSHVSKPLDIKEQYITETALLRSKLGLLMGHEAFHAFEEECKRRLEESEGLCLRTISNDQLAHELLLNPKFRFDVACNCTSDHNACCKLHHDFWDFIRRDLELVTPCYVMVVQVLVHICNMLDRGSISGNSGIYDVVDIQHVQTQLFLGHFDWQRVHQLLSCILDAIRRLEHSSRSIDTLTKWQELEAAAPVHEDGDNNNIPHAVCKRLAFLFHRAYLTTLDSANARLRLISPAIQEHGVLFERNRFEEKLKEGHLTLERTTAWIHHAITKPEDLVGASVSAYLDVHMEAICSLVTQPQSTIITASTCPETLLFDVDHLVTLQKAFRSQATAATMMMTLAAALPPADLAKHKARLVEILAVENLNAEEAIGKIHAALLLLADSDRIIALLTKCLEPAHHVHALIAKRLILYWTMGSPNSALAKIFGFMSPLIESSARRFKRLVEINWQVHLRTYLRIIAEEARKKRGALPTQKVDD